MYKLHLASISVRKAAMLHYRISQGNYYPMFNDYYVGHLRDGDVIGIIYNNRHPDGVKITKEMAKEASLLTWKEIKG